MTIEESDGRSFAIGSFLPNLMGFNIVSGLPAAYRIGPSVITRGFNTDSFASVPVLFFYLNAVISQLNG